ncbi:MAG: hypothetical protein A3E31_13980 [Candidatus Rokubacteria bacterium RIFCSPHIGHO2_12_FULL_73_22]|nr:MAG: hypothetical protein A3D33_09670 [Candidatus Rokubacteria bacterium RIFCSPHIGHO2_02_FULL_73_26]OGL04606.1 MAG: hypothetical protein A3E31_13980 [Candidatus Rokubacteria bacterium RIFCSPHIGHO2_12_FULL_73_22]OGL07595.1 MAG: hypothetical protein A3I14_15810 [Candidatus Rokubacteria bacterium RIFCSPLOWO2_02_FULL_73_56]OGL22996.1 MAG: hypothetical protein A3G44_03150 [Candidatus Rokubacteria bacterium RIFCSPLOWO2_12_FULL_73_47]
MRPHTIAIELYLFGGAALEPWYSACKGGDDDACRTWERQLALTRAEALTLMRRIASSFCNAAAPGATAVAIRIRVESAVPWSRRGAEPRRVRLADVGVYPVERDVAPATFYRP